MTTKGNDPMVLSQMEADIIGEVMNISMGAAATALSTVLDKKVSITAPKLQVTEVASYDLTSLEPILGVVVRYVEGIGGFNMLFLKEDDFKQILGHLLSMDPASFDEFDEISLSAISEIMNQMMGSAASALATFLGVKTNISTPDILQATKGESILEKAALDNSHVVAISFDISIEDLVQSEFVSIMEPDLVREIIRLSMGENPVDELPEEVLLEEVPSAPPASPAAPVAAAAPPPQAVYQAPPPAQAPPPVQAVQMPPPVQPAQVAPMATVQAVPYQYPDLTPEPKNGPAEDSNMGLIMSVPIQITVELGKTRRKIKEVSEFAPGHIIELDRQAGDQVDIMANGKLVARGDVVVVDDNYSVRITEIMKARDSLADL